MNTSSIRTHLLLLVLAVSVPLVAIVGYGIYHDLQHTVTHTKTSLRPLASMMVSNTGGRITNARQILERLAERPLVKQVDPNHCDGALKDMLSINPGYANIAYTDMDGLTVCSALPQPGGKAVNMGKSPWFQTFLKERRFTVGPPFLGLISGKWVSVLSAPIWNDHHELVGSIRLPLDLAAFDPHIPSHLLPAESHYGFYAQDGTLIWQNSGHVGAIGTKPNTDAARKITEVREGEFESLGLNGVPRFYSVIPMPETGWTAFLSVPSSAVYAEPKRRATTLVAIALGVVTILVLLAIVIARRIARPVAELERAAQAVHGGDLGVRAAIGGPSEIAAVALEFNAMVAAQQHSEERLRAFLENSSIIAWMKDEGGRYMFASDNFLRRFALSWDAIAKKADHEIWPQAIADEFRLYNLESLPQGHAIEAVEAATNPDGSTSWWLSNKFIFQSSDGKRLRCGLAVDITKQKQVEEALRHSETKFHTLYETTSDAVMLLDENGFFDCNKATLEIFGCPTREEFCSKHPADLSPPVQPCGTDSMVLANQRIAAAMKKGGHRFEWMHRRADTGEDFPAEVLLSAMELDGKPILQATVRDISERKQDEKVLLAAIIAAEAANRAKSEFLASMSHELRTPLNSILGFSQLFGMDPNLTKDAKEQARAIEQAGKHLLSLVNDLIDLSRIEAGKLELSLGPVSVKSVLVDSLDLAAPIASQQGIEIDQEISGCGTATVHADYVRLRQVVINLLSNAIKYNRPQGTVRLSCRLNEDKVRIVVSDTGRGIPANKQSRIFNAFDRLGEERGRVEGTGIGLIITKRLIKSMDGSIGFESAEGQGSTFWVEFPTIGMAALPAAEATEPSSVPEIIS